jgi:hypothetical protein
MYRISAATRRAITATAALLALAGCQAGTSTAAGTSSLHGFPQAWGGK